MSGLHFSSKPARRAKSFLTRIAKATCAGVLCLTGARRAMRTVAHREVNGHRLVVLAYHLPLPTTACADGPLLGSLCVSKDALRRQGLQDLGREWEIVEWTRPSDACRRR